MIGHKNNRLIARQVLVVDKRNAIAQKPIAIGKKKIEHIDRCFVCPVTQKLITNPVHRLKNN
jgi:hypothetical protein